jgi:hypothetical protein
MTKFDKISKRLDGFRDDVVVEAVESNPPIVRDLPDVFMLVLIDNVPPNINHTPLSAASLRQAAPVSVTVQDNVGVKSATLYYRSVGQSSWNSSSLQKSGNVYTGAVPASAVTSSAFQYYLQAEDTNNNLSSVELRDTTSFSRIR